MKKILFLGLNNNQVGYIKEIKKLEFFIVGTDLNIDAPGIALVDTFYKCGYDDYDTLIDIGQKENFTALDKVFTASSQFAHLGAAYFADYFKIDYPKFNDIKLCLDKSLYYTFFQNNNIPLPKTWYIKTKEELEKILLTQPPENSFYLKSDNSKNPKYVYSFLNKNLNNIQINWNKDRYFQEYYILQEEFYGEHIRVNIFGNKLSVYHFEIDRLNDNRQYQIDLIKNSKLLETLKELLQKLNMKNWLLKFDVIVNKDFNFVVLDIGMDPPYRMRKDYTNKNHNFEESYCRMYLLSQDCFLVYDGILHD